MKKRPPGGTGRAASCRLCRLSQEWEDQGASRAPNTLMRCRLSVIERQEWVEAGTSPTDRRTIQTVAAKDGGISVEPKLVADELACGLGVGVLG